jgi:hypothetical protein
MVMVVARAKALAKVRIRMVDMVIRR